MEPLFYLMAAYTPFAVAGIIAMFLEKRLSKNKAENLNPPA